MQNINLFVRYVQTNLNIEKNGLIERSAPISIIDCYRFGVVPIDIWRSIPEHKIIISESSDNIIPVRTSNTITHPLSLEIIEQYLKKQIPHNKVIIMKIDQSEFCNIPKEHEHIKCYNCGETKLDYIFSYPDNISKELKTCFMKHEFCSEQSPNFVL
jgi:DNA-directed RNA polymerase subunit M/transcription elongation factor TFIIS